MRAADAAPEALAAAASARLLGVGETVRWSSLDGAVPLLVVMADAGGARRDRAGSGRARRTQAERASPPMSYRHSRGAPILVRRARSLESSPTSAGPRILPGSEQEISMLKWAIIFAVIALIAGVLGFTGVAAGAAGIAKILFVVFLVLFVAVLLFALLGAKAVSNK